MPRYRILPYNQGSRSARALADALGGRVLRLRGSTFVPRRDDVIINWGNTEPQRAHVHPATFINLPNQIRNASNKLNFFNTMVEHNLQRLIPDFWTRREDIPNDAFNNGGIIVCRTELAGHSGAGIVLARDIGELVRAPLYVRYVKKQDEYRIHVGVRNNEPIVISQQRKARRADVAEPNWQIRNHANGFIFVREGVNPPESVIANAKAALVATGLDFGAVDVIWNEREQRAYILEINTAPGLEGQTVTDYANFFRGGQ